MSEKNKSLKKSVSLQFVTELNAITHPLKYYGLKIMDNGKKDLPRSIKILVFFNEKVCNYNLEEVILAVSSLYFLSKLQTMNMELSAPENTTPKGNTFATCLYKFDFYYFLELAGS